MPSAHPTCAHPIPSHPLADPGPLVQHPSPDPTPTRTGHIDLDALLFCPLEDLLQHDVRNLLDLGLGELAEHDDLVQAVEELRPAARV